MVDEVVVVGAGVSGLTTAVVLAESGVPTRILTDRPTSDTTSMVAGALWGPSFQPPFDKTLEWTAQSLEDFQRLATDPSTGVRIADVLTVGRGLPDGEPPPQVTMIPGLREATSDELPPGFGAGSWGRMPVADMPTYLDYLEGRLAAAGGHIDRTRVTDLAEAGDRVVNCAGLGARELAADDTLRPIFGQHVIVTNPGLDNVFMELGQDAEWTSFMPHPERVVCGGVRIPDRYDLTPDDDLTARILERCRRVEPRLRDATIIETVTGLRPDRPSVRVAVEWRGRTLIVHNYGHSGTGVSLSWGCAREAARLITKG